MKKVEEIKEKLRRLCKKVEEKRTDYIKAEKAYESCFEEASEVADKVSEEIKNTETYKRCEELMSEVRKLVKEITHCKREAIKLFSYFKPFSYKRKVISIGGGYLVVGNLIYEALWRDQRRYPSLGEVFQTFVRYGNIVIPNVRKTIREELAEFHTLAEDLTTELKFGEDFVVRRGEFRTFIINAPYVVKEGSTLIGQKVFDKISIRVDLIYPSGYWHIIFFNSEDVESTEEEADILGSPFRFLELYDVLADMCDEARRKLQAKKERCEEIIKEMREVVAPHILSKL